MKKIKAENRQSILDIAIQEYGNADMFFDIILENNIKEITSNIYNILLKIPELKKNKEVLKILNNKKITTL